VLVLSRKLNQAIMIGDDVRIVVVAVDRDTVKLGIEAPRTIPVHRSEVYEEIQPELKELVEDVLLNRRPDATERLVDFGEALKAVGGDATSTGAKKAEEWRDGNRGALTMGGLHGAWCVGCCWVLMAALFALGVISSDFILAGTFLPEGVIPYLAADTTAVGQIFWYTLDGGDLEPGRRWALQKYLVGPEINSVPGVAEVGTVGGMPLEYQIDVDPNALRAYNVTLGELYEAVARSNSAVGGRVVQKNNAEYLIRSVGWIENVDDIRESPPFAVWELLEARGMKGEGALRITVGSVSFSVVSTVGRRIKKVRVSKLQQPSPNGQVDVPQN